MARLDRDPAAWRRGFAIADFPMTAREAAYFRDRDRVQDETHAVGSYAEVDGLSGGVAEDDYPAGAFVALRVTRPLTDSERQDLDRLRAPAARRRFVSRRPSCANTRTASTRTGRGGGHRAVGLVHGH